MSAPEHVIVGGRKLVEMLSNTQLAQHVMVGGIKIFGRGSDWVVSGERMISVAEVTHFASQSNLQNQTFRLQFDGGRNSSARIFLIEANEGVSDRDFDRINSYRDSLDRSNEHLINAGKNVAQAFGWGLAGDYGQAMEKSVDAFADLIEMMYEDFRR